MKRRRNVIVASLCLAAPPEQPEAVPADEYPLYDAAVDAKFLTSRTKVVFPAPSGPTRSTTLPGASRAAMAAPAASVSGAEAVWKLCARVGRTAIA